MVILKIKDIVRKEIEVHFPYYVKNGDSYIKIMSEEKFINVRRSLYSNGILIVEDATNVIHHLEEGEKITEDIFKEVFELVQSKLSSVNNYNF